MKTFLFQSSAGAHVASLAQPMKFLSSVQSWILGGLISAAVLLGAGCQHAVKIELPKSGTSTSPVTTFQVRFHSDFKPGTFLATLNGENITGRFNPPAVAGGVSTASSDFMDGSNSSQKLHVQGDFKTVPGGIDTRLRDDDVEFDPPLVFIYRDRTSFNNDVSVHERETITATVLVLQAPKEELKVTITTDENAAVSLNDQPAGVPIIVTIPTNDRRADFTIRGIQTGKTFIVRPLAHGFASRLGGGTVLSP